MRKIKLIEHLTLTEIEEKYRRASDGVGCSQSQIIWLLAQGKRTVDIAETTGYSEVWIRTLSRRYNAAGEAGIGDRRHENAGRERLLNSTQEAALGKALQTARERGETWSGIEVAQWMSEQLGRPVHKQRGYEVLARLQQTLQVPRPAHAAADVADQAAFKKRSFPR